MPNRLADSTSSYLRQHANQPIDWQPWGEAAFAAARERGVPTFISIGHASCHWCHEMARESFDDPQVAEFLNAHFVSIKVDREEHPAVDSVYLDAAQGISGTGGWPLTIFATPDGDAFAAGTYFPPLREDTTPSFLEFAANVAKQWADAREEITEAAQRITSTLKYSRDHFAGALAFTEPSNKHAPFDEVLPDPPKRSDFSVDKTIAKIREQYDTMYGGFGEAPKFLHAPLLTGLLHHDFEGWMMAYGTLLAISRGGLHDVVGGGFMPYSTTRDWRHPHFEKMLADNAQMLTIFSFASSKARVLGMDARGLERAGRGIVAWLQREMRSAAGGFYTSVDSEAEDDLGDSYAGIQIAWTRAEVAEVLGQEDAEWTYELLGMNPLGVGDDTPMLSSFKLDPAELDQERVASVLNRLLDARLQRPQPVRDEQIVAEWNGLVIDALVTAALHFDAPELIDLAEDAATYIWHTHRVDGRLRRSSRAGTAASVRVSEGNVGSSQVSAAADPERNAANNLSAGTAGPALGTAGDLGAMAMGMLRLAAVRGDQVWLERALSLLEEADAHFTAQGGGWFDPSEDDPSLIYRPRNGSDDASPSPTSLLITANKLASRLGHRERRSLAHQAERSRIQRLLAGPVHAGWALHDAILRASVKPPAETVVTAPTKAEAWPLAVEAARQAEPGELILIGDPTIDSSAFGGLFEARTAVAEPTAYVCRAGICELPRTSFKPEGEAAR